MLDVYRELLESNKYQTNYTERKKQNGIILLFQIHCNVKRKNIVHEVLWYKTKNGSLFIPIRLNVNYVIVRTKSTVNYYENT